MAISAIRLVRRALNRAWFVIMLFILCHFTAGILFSLLETVPFADGQWWATVTAATVGYGDMFPVTFWGRTMAQVYMFVMLILTAFIIGHIASAVIEDKNLFSNNEQEQMEGALLLVGKHLGVFSTDMKKLPSVQWFEAQGMDLDETTEEEQAANETQETDASPR